MSNMRKLCLIVSHTDIVDVISELIRLECLEPIVPEVTLDPPELTDLLRSEVMELDVYEANFENITLLSTQYTYYLTGWLPAIFETELISMLSRYMCAWEITDPSPSESEDMPVMIKHPQLLGRMRSGGRRIFVPLTKSYE